MAIRRRPLGPRSHAHYLARPASKLIDVVQADQYHTTFTYSGASLSSLNDPANRVTTFEHDSNGHLIKITDPDLSVREFGYDAAHHLTTQTSKRGFETTYDYGANGRITNVLQPDGATRAFAPSQLISVGDPANGIGTKTNPVPVVRPDELVATFTNGNGKVVTYETDRFGAVTSRTDPLNRTRTIVRNIHGRPLITTTPNGAIAWRSYDTQGNVLALVEAEGQPEERTTSFEYDAIFNRVNKITDPAGKVTTIDIDPTNGNIQQITNPLLDDRVFTYETTSPLMGLVKTVTDENGKTTTFTYDAKGNLDTITDPELNLMRFVRDVAGNVLTLIQGEGTPEQRTRTFTYDALNRLTSATDGTANPATQFRYDTQGNLEETELPTGEIEQRT